VRASSRRGSTLIEVLVALVLLAVLGTAFITLLGQTAHTMRSVLESERQMRGAGEILDRLAVVSRRDLLARTGRTSLPRWTIEISQTSPTLFDVAVSNVDGGLTLARTTFYRPDSANAAQ